MAEFDYIKREFKKLGSMSFILVGIFLILGNISNLLSSSFIIVGAFLVLEHIYTYGNIYLLDFLGHEWIGFILIILGCLIIGLVNLVGIIFFISGCLLANDWNFDHKKGWEETKGKIKYLFRI